MLSIIPEATRHAAKRAFIRTAAQSLATSFALPAGITLALTREAWLAAVFGIGGVVIGAGVNGVQAYCDIIARGIPGDYQASADSSRGEFVV
ncbi:hypothetical protein [Leucobacter japonicus]|uniref:hypothetical protein n=1 Tax=Leucobacter japonicus TaxID=1461259 RepID=UPI0006A7CA8E|nr:hypothetical protein [Leucobacter japonicus]